MDFAPEYLSRLAAARAAAVGTLEAGTAPWRHHRAALARKAGQDAASEHLTWAQVAAFRELLPVARDPLKWAGPWGRARIEAVAGLTVAQLADITTDGEFLAWLEGVNDVAAAVEASA